MKKILCIVLELIIYAVIFLVTIGGIVIYKSRPADVIGGEVFIPIIDIILLSAIKKIGGHYEI